MNLRDVNAGAALISLPGWRREKLQVLRWLAHDRHRLSPPVLGALERSLADPDWELRVTAMLAAARLQAGALAAAVARMPLPQSQAQGLSAEELRLVHALRDAALAALGHARDRPLPPGVAEALRGDYTVLRPGLAACVHALAEPLPAEVPEPPPGAGIVLAEEGPQLADGTLLAWVPPVAHWLGDDALRHALPNPARLQPAGPGFYIDAEAGGSGTLMQAHDAAREAASRLGRPVALASRQAWEMAARGPDGRRFPWGMNAEPGVRTDLSPWGMAGVLPGTGEWLDDSGNVHSGNVHSGDAGVVAGGRRSPAPARHTLAAAGTVHAYRFTY